MEISACRLCLAKEHLAPLFGKLSPCHFTRNQVYLATGVVILPSDSLPQVACKACIERIKSAILLRNTSIETQNKLQQIQNKTNNTYDKETSNLLYEIDNFTTKDEDLNKFLKKINKDVRKTINSLTVNSQHDNNSHIDNKIANDHLNTESNIDNESNNSQTDNFNYQTDFDHNYHRKSNNIMPVKVTSDGMTKYTERDLRKNNTQNVINTKTRKVFIISGKDDKLNKNLISRLNKKLNNTIQSNPALLPTRKFRQLFQSTKKIETQKRQNSSKILNKGQKTECKEKTIHIKHTDKTNVKKKSQFDNEISQCDNKSGCSDNSNNHDDEDDFNSFKETEDWRESLLKEFEDQKRIHKKRQEKFMSLAVSQNPTKERLQCKVCLQWMPRRGFVSHAVRHFPPEFACETCGKMFYGNSLLRYHRQRMHGQEKPLACPMCDYRAVMKLDLTCHMRIHTGERPYICDVCNASFRVRGDIVQHMRTHFGIKKIKCPRCPHKLFRCLSDVAKHNRRAHHRFTYFCHLCPKTYHGNSGRKSIRKHLARIHGIPLAEQPLKLKYTKIPKPDEFQEIS